MGVGYIGWGRGPYVWYRAQDLAATLSNGDPVTTWVDRTGNGFDLTVPGGQGSPTFRAADLNGLATVEFDGVNDALRHLGCDIASSTTEWTMFAVFLTDNAATQQEIVNGDSQLGATRGPVFLYITSAGALAMIDEHSDVIESSGQTVSASTWHLGESWRSATQMEALLDGTGNGPTNDTVIAGAEVGIFLGYHPAGPGSFLDGKIAEVIGWNRVLDASERTTQRAYFAAQYGV